jgi:hypothetical protein
MEDHMNRNMLTLKPGLIVSLSARMAGGVRYERKDLEKDVPTDGPSVEKWETVKVVQDPEEYERAIKVRGKCRSLIASACTRSVFGLLCPSDKEKVLDDAIGEARTLADTFNASAATVQISVYVLKGRIAETDQEAAGAIADELKGLLGEMREGIASMDVKRIRDAASTAKQMGRMLDELTAKKLSAAVEEARFVAKEITRRLDDPDEAEGLAAYVQDIKLASLSEERFAFLDMDPVEPGEGGAAPAMVEEAPRAVEIDTEESERADVEAGDDSEMDAAKAAATFEGPKLDV